MVSIAPRAKGTSTPWFPDEISEVQRDTKGWPAYKKGFKIRFKNSGYAVSSLPSVLVPICLLRSENISVKIRARRFSVSVLALICSHNFVSTFYYIKQRFITMPGCDQP